jgi:hypothetical protein
MTRTDLTALMESHWQQIQELNRRKGKDYAGDFDALLNFKTNAERWGLTPLQVWGVYCGKHWDAIQTYVRNNGQVESEPIEGRLHDVIVYAFLLLGLIEEQKAKDDAEWQQTRQRVDAALAQPE